MAAVCSYWGHLVNVSFGNGTVLCQCPEPSYHLLSYRASDCKASFTVPMLVFMAMSAVVFTLLVVIAAIKLQRMLMARPPSSATGINEATLTENDAITRSSEEAPLLWPANQQVIISLSHREEMDLSCKDKLMWSLQQWRRRWLPYTVVVLWLIIGILFGWSPLILWIWNPTFDLRSWRYFILLGVFPVILVGLIQVTVYCGWAAEYFWELAYPRSFKQWRNQLVGFAFGLLNLLALVGMVALWSWGFSMTPNNFQRVLLNSKPIFLGFCGVTLMYYVLAFARLGVSLFLFWRVFFQQAPSPPLFARVMMLQWYLHIGLAFLEISAMIVMILTVTLLPAISLLTIFFGSTFTFLIFALISLSVINDNPDGAFLFFPLQQVIAYFFQDFALVQLSTGWRDSSRSSYSHLEHPSDDPASYIRPPSPPPAQATRTSSTWMTPALSRR